MEKAAEKGERCSSEDEDNQERSTKKIKLMHEDFSVPPISPGPYRDSLLGHNQGFETHQNNTDASEVMEEDVEGIEIIHGKVPKVVFPARAHEIMNQYWK